MVSPSFEGTSTWPAIAPRAYQGIFGGIVETFGPHTEADPAALLLTSLAAFGNAAGPRPHMRAGADDHSARLFVLLTGDTSRARKGSAVSVVRRLMKHADPEWSANLQVLGIGSGEALVEELAASEATGSHDPRRFIDEPEFARFLKAAHRDNSTLSPMIRSAWDGVDLGRRTRGTRTKVSNHHVSMVGQITADELARTLTSEESANGFANRLLIAVVRRSKKLPSGGSLTDGQFEAMGRLVRAHLDEASAIDAMRWTPDAEADWTAWYNSQPDGRPGLFGALTARAEPQVLRLCVTYAIAAGSQEITSAHFGAAVAVWDYCEQSVRYLYGDRTGNRDADRLLDALRDAGEQGLDFTQQTRLFANHGGKRLERARHYLQRIGLAETTSQDTGGRPRSVTRAIGVPQAKKAKEGTYDAFVASGS